MAYATASITSITPAKDLMAALVSPLTSAGFTAVETYGSPANNTWPSVTYGGSQFVAVANASTSAATSPDGVTWTTRSLPVSASWTSVAYGGGVYVAVANGPTTIAASSTDGITWTQRTMPASADWQAVAYGGGVFVAVSTSSGIAASSTDGVTWTQRALGSAQSFKSVTYGGGMFAAVTTGSTVAASSPDGITWTLRTLPTSTTWSSVTYGGGMFAAVGGTTSAASSPDGITWTARTLPASSTWTGVTYGGSTFVAVASGSTIAATSPDGITWTQRTTPASATWNSVGYGGSTYVALGGSQSIGATSSDGITWTQRILAVISTNTIADVYKSPAASNQFGSDWYLILRRGSDTATTLFYQVAETYNATTHRVGNIGGTAQAVIPTATTYTNPALATAPDATATFGAAAFLQLTTTAFSYWVSATANRLVVGVKTATELGFYAGLYDDLLPSGVTQFPLVCARLPNVQTSAGPSIGNGSGSTAGGFTREPGQSSSSGVNFEAAIHNGFFNGSVTQSNFSPLPTSAALYGNAGAMSRCMIGSARGVGTIMSDGVRGLLTSVFCSGITSISGDTITTGGKTYVRFGGAATTFGFFIDSAL